MKIKPISKISKHLHKPRDPFFQEMVKKKQGAHKSKKKVLERKQKHKGRVDFTA